MFQGGKWRNYNALMLKLVRKRKHTSQRILSNKAEMEENGRGKIANSSLLLVGWKFTMVSIFNICTHSVSLTHNSVFTK
jgi:hypothetical protein